MKDIVLYFKNKKIEEQKERKKALKERLLRYFEDGQQRVHGRFSLTKNDILKSNLFNAEDFNIIAEVLEELCSEGVLEYDSGYYYLKGYSLKF